MGLVASRGEAEVPDGVLSHDVDWVRRSVRSVRPAAGGAWRWHAGDPRRVSASGVAATRARRWRGGNTATMRNPLDPNLYKSGDPAIHGYPWDLITMDGPDHYPG